MYCIPANTPPVFPGMRPRIWLHLLRLATKTMPDRFLRLDFLRDTLTEGQLFRALRVLDQWSRQSPLREVGTGGQAFGRVWDGMGGPRAILVTHDTKFQSQAFEDWAYHRGVQLDLIRPGKPMKNACIESIGRLRDD